MKPKAMKKLLKFFILFISIMSFHRAIGFADENGSGIYKVGLRICKCDGVLVAYGSSCEEGGDRKCLDNPCPSCPIS